MVTLLGLLGAIGLVLAALALGGSASAFVDLPSILIVVGGTGLVTLACFSVGALGRTYVLVAKALSHRSVNPADAGAQVLQLAEMARKGGVFGLQSVLPELRPAPFLQRAIGMVIDGATGEEVEKLLQREVAMLSQHSAVSANVLRKAAEVAPAMGLIGTLVGLVQMLGNLNDPASIGPSMAVALLTTLYGAMLSNMVFSPLAAKLERNSAEDVLLNTVYLTGAASIGRKENPRRLELLINTLLPPAQRIRYFD